MGKVKNYWENRYKIGGNSGVGSYTTFFEHKTNVINQIIEKYNINSIVDYGCGDGNQISKLNIGKYIGLDISDTAVNLCKTTYINDETKSFLVYSENKVYGNEQLSDMSMSLDVIYHIFEDDLYKNYMDNLFNTGEKYVLIYSTNHVYPFNGTHTKGRCITEYIEVNHKDWELIDTIEPQNHKTNFYLYKKN